MFTFDHSRFQFSHGRGPRGRGFWMFELDGQTFEASGTFTEAKQAVIAQAKAQGITSGRFVVCP